MATIVVGTNSYVTEAELTTYANDRGVTLVATPAVLLIKAMDYIEAQDYKGCKTEEDQALQWPRNEVYTGKGCCYPCKMLDKTIVPSDIKNTQMILALQIDLGNDPLATQGQAVKSETVDVVSVVYQDNTDSSPQLKAVRLLLSKYLANGAGTNSIRVSKA